MDRFIVLLCNNHNVRIFPLKSNMDRFIVHRTQHQISFLYPLKSNMDRFIAPPFITNIIPFLNFKIQYG